MKSLTDLQSDSKVGWVKLTHIINFTLHTHIHKRRLTGVQLLIAYGHLRNPLRVGRRCAVIGAEVTADCCNRNPPAGLFSLFLLLQIIQGEKKKEPCDFKICAFVIAFQRGGNLESV